MAQCQITLEEDVVQHLFVGDGGVARLLEQVLNRVLQAQAREALQAAPYERTAERRGYLYFVKPFWLWRSFGDLPPREIPRLAGGRSALSLSLGNAAVATIFPRRSPNVRKTQKGLTKYTGPPSKMRRRHTAPDVPVPHHPGLRCGRPHLGIHTRAMPSPEGALRGRRRPRRGLP